MLKTAILYSTVDGQTLAICQRIEQVLRESGEQVTVINLTDVTAEQLAAVDKVVIGASIRYGKHRPELFKFAAQHRALLDTKLNSFFTVNVVARKPLKNTPETNPYMQKFLTLSVWKPKLLGVFAGKIDYPRYRFFDKVMIRFIMWMTKGPTDTSGTFEFTDWNKVEGFAKDIAAQKH
ncbi:menaquinone-dependent protoporphyrinogen IX dehydrogenase [Shewanella saliphila]|uniref:Protoporphyrinogen IX dehydrogenase [quinone] n=1 Tax=Shewanella saliphila TaxID=2282698 RepID=A0ABQ2Q864_9GAMM|nr:menaquinone-dependent protoporphyrinogen IX dehydrogenase [Shewanella saliphila]MCL1102584.1 menaquinone-dependent protoporphyrinogen IX dehydrogenase [Shewanella saliphila]GGP57308.1 protoporphyrinogen oxidase [Shewanella saliphila]